MSTKPKITPRNLTAFADYIVPGNPASSRPESGMDVSSPGLEMDMRALEERFFPGLVFSFESTEGAVVREMRLTPEQQTTGLQPSDNHPEDPLFLIALVGSPYPGEAPMFSGFRNHEGNDVYRRVRDLAEDRVTLLLGKRNSPAWEDAVATFDDLSKAHEATQPTLRNFIRRADDGTLAWAVLSAKRVSYLDAAGVIDPNLYDPGEFTKSLCAPWQYDFRDCSCFYWASNAPDMVSAGKDKEPYVYFWRNRLNHSQAPDLRISGERSAMKHSVLEFLDHVWNDFPVVLNDRETMDSRPSRQELPPDDLFNREQLIAEVQYLATVEHALMVEFLYAVFSIQFGPGQPPEWESCRKEVMRIAVDEMRHFLWANMILSILGQPPSLARAHVIGAVPSPGDGRRKVNIQYLDERFSLRRLDTEALSFFIKVEAKSQSLEGMYGHIYASIQQQSDLFPESPRLLPLVKLLMDEGQNHYERFLNVKSTLAPFETDSWLKRFIKPDQLAGAGLHLAHLYYECVLRLLYLSLIDVPDTAEYHEFARSLMTRLEELLNLLGERPVDFRWPAVHLKTEDKMAAVLSLLDRQSSISDALNELGGEEKGRELSRHQMQANAKWFADLTILLERHRSRNSDV